MVPSLNPRYFTKLSERNNGMTYQLYYCCFDSIILYSSDGTPLVSVSLKCANELSSRAIIAPQSGNSNNQFLGVITENDQEFQFVITNLSPLGMIKIDILSKNQAVNSVDLSENYDSVNKVNEIPPFVSHLIRSDQSNNRTMILSSGVHPPNQSKESMSGCMFYISVTPQKNIKQLVSYFDNTRWVKDNIFVILKKPQDLDNVWKIPNVESPKLTSNITKSVPSKPFIKPGVPIIETFSPTPYDYEYNVSSNLDGMLCSLSLSVKTGTRQLPMVPLSEHRSIGNDLIDLYIKNQQGQYINNLGKIFIQEECSICLTKDIDTVFYDCGHSCCHRVCSTTLTYCPICRRNIVCVLNI